MNSPCYSHDGYNYFDPHKTDGTSHQPSLGSIERSAFSYVDPSVQYGPSLQIGPHAGGGGNLQADVLTRDVGASVNSWDDRHVNGLLSTVAGADSMSDRLLCTIKSDTHTFEAYPASRTVGSRATVESKIDWASIYRLQGIEWECQNRTRGKLLAQLNANKFDVEERPHGFYPWLIVPSPIKVALFRLSRKIEDKHIKVELQTKMEYAISPLNKLNLYAGNPEPGCCCAKNLYQIDGTVPTRSGDKYSNIRCRIQLQWIVYHCILACYGYESEAKFKDERFQISCDTPLCSEIQAMPEVLAYFPSWQAVSSKARQMALSKLKEEADESDEDYAFVTPDGTEEGPEEMEYDVV